MTAPFSVVPFVANGDYAAGDIVNFASVIFQDKVGSFTRGGLLNSVAPPGTANAVFKLTYIQPGLNEVHYVGAPLFEPLPAMLRYFDANFSPSTDYWWEGTPNLSASDYYPNLPAKLSRLISVLPSYIPIGATFSLAVGGANPTVLTQTGTPGTGVG